MRARQHGERAHLRRHLRVDPAAARKRCGERANRRDVPDTREELLAIRRRQRSDLLERRPRIIAPRSASLGAAEEHEHIRRSHSDYAEHGGEPR